MPNRAIERSPSRRTLLLSLLWLGLGVAVVLAAYVAAYRHGLAEVRLSAQRQLEFLAANLASALDKYETLPTALAGYPDQMALLREPGNPALRDAVNQRLALMAERTHAASIYLIDAQGETLAASNWATPVSFVGQNFAYRPYFREALAEGAGRYYAVGTTSRQPGYFLAHRVPQELAPGQQALGVVVVKILLDDIEANWRQDPSLLALADARGVVFLSNREDWKFRTLAPLSEAQRAQIGAERQYGDAALQALPLREAGGDGVAQIGQPDHDGHGDHPARWLPVVSERAGVGSLGWSLLAFSAVDEAEQLAGGVGAAAGFAYAFVFVAALYARLRRRRAEEQRRAQRELERVHGQERGRQKSRPAPGRVAGPI